MRKFVVTIDGKNYEVGVEEIGAVAAAGEKMPQKSTYFYPKLITGLVMNSLEAPLED